MKQDNDYKHPVPENSYSRELDSRVQEQEMPYGYSDHNAPADTGDYNEKSHESKKEYKPRKSR
jgi:hypothetical protein